ncbi:hypothetical protein NP233_g9750 [Leucocoprinus birnbaumii]|uniref:Cytochrome P450 n=1 Tax=Leucocoprinus birnbaumii TaxID=56174 RepID=A0AAD5VK26_9AGAR|nr:hypothetical protein NP233_g9750 [Leucocoprinus birnbaumii]
MSEKVTLQNVISQADSLLKLRLAMLNSSASSFKVGNGVDKAIQTHQEALLMKEGMEQVLHNVTCVMLPISVADRKEAISFARDLRGSCSILVDISIQKKELLDSLPIRNITKLIAQDLKVNYEAMVTLTNVLIGRASVRAVNTSKSVWGPDAEEYRPERWLNRSVDFNIRDSFQSFFSGSHGCAGKTLAIMELKIIITKLITNFEFDLAYERQVPQLTYAFVMIPKDDMPLRVRRLQDTGCSE